ncbi:ribokinase-like domain-containing protein [Candidatus Uzinura diaspidicola str. ASNER]|uniref:Ribokinase-like domain-containing protein n=1 Tax=Candidatus Uzinura diaspidicola str. ASNER TaxID=1133592 RepID=L7VN79_9FLAO|nr:ribokinase-like domain-containing protein [Candidatus Uzinura diaspidicola str. ASNER]
MEKSIKKIVCYGEVLWDLLPSGLKPGGAPLNVAYHLKKLGVKSSIISSVGDDILGEELLKIIKKWGVDSTFCRKDNNFPTGKVLAKEDTLFQEVSYEIMEPVAWDFIVVEKDHSKIINNTDAFVFQSLTARNEISRKTLHALLEYSYYKIFDVNLRPPFYSENIIKELLEKSDLVKMSVSELYEIVSWFKKGKISEEEAVCFLKECFNLKELLITKGSYGASYYGIDNLYERFAIPIIMSDPIGSGDAFLAGFLAKKINGKSIEEALESAISLGAFVASKEGSCPYYDMDPSKEFAQLL